MEVKQAKHAYRIKNLTFTYPGRQVAALKNVNLTIKHGEFVTFCGPSGCGKTTLLRQLIPLPALYGAKTGAIYFYDTELSQLTQRDQAARIGFVMQSPENQIVTDKVWHELAFGLESLGVKTPEIRRRIAEMASFFGIQTWFHKEVKELSGGQKQLLALASTMAMHPTVLILDEPTSQLDPIAASEFLGILAKINRELGVTVILTEHRLEEAFPLSDRAVVMDGGEIISDGTPAGVGLALREREHDMFLAMPTAMRIWAALPDKYPCPVTVRDGREWLSLYPPKDMKPLGKETVRVYGDTALEVYEAWFKYDKDLPDVVKGLSFNARFGEFTAILGGNGTGKTTSLSLIAGLNAPYRGKIRVNGRVAALPQNHQALFVKKTMREDLLEILGERKLSKVEKERRLTHMVKLCRLDGLLDSHPYDLSGGEQQRAALAKVLLLQPEILLLDEPTKGFDAEFKRVFAGILKKLTDAGVSVVMVSHDVEFCAEYADRCVLFFDGSIVSEGTPREFFSGNSFYTSSANRMARDVIPHAVTAHDVIFALGGEMHSPIAPIVSYGDGNDELSYELPGEEKTESNPKVDAGGIKSLPLASKYWASAFAFVLLASILLLLSDIDGLKAFITDGDIAVKTIGTAYDVWRYCGIMLGLAVGAAGLSLSLTRSRSKVCPPIERKSRKLSRRTLAATFMIVLLIPLTLYIGYFHLDDRKYLFISMLIIFETMLPFALIFEGRKPQARELVIIAVLCAIAVAGRAVFFMLPQFKPVVAVVIIAAIAFGGEVGFLVGAMTGLVSNFFFGQGPWTPWQMFVFGIIGLLAGILSGKGILRSHPVSLAIFGGITTFAIYGGIMNPAIVLITQTNITKEMIIAAYLQGIPFDIIHAAATVTFLLIASRPMLEKLDRIKMKYGLFE